MSTNSDRQLFKIATTAKSDTRESAAKDVACEAAQSRFDRTALLAGRDGDSHCWRQLWNLLVRSASTDGLS